MTTLSWKIDDEINLVNGFIRNVEKMMNNNIIPKSIFMLIALFYDSFLKQIKSAANKQFFRSRLFEVSGFKWCIELNPNGMNAKRIGNFELLLNLAHLPPNIKSIRVLRQHHFQELNVNYEKSTTYSYSTGYSWPQNTLKLSAIQDCNQLTFSIKINLSEVLDTNGNDITSEYKHNKAHKLALPLRGHSFRHCWTIADSSTIEQLKLARNVQEWRSNIFCCGGFKWYLRFYPNGYKSDTIGYANLFLYVAYLPPNVKQVNCGMELNLNELGEQRFIIWAFCIIIDICKIYEL